MNKGFTAGLMAAAVLAGLPAAVSAQSTGPRALPRFGADVDVVNLSVSVADRGRNYVTGLEKQDFTVLEDGIRQEVSVFEKHDVPLSVAILIDSSLSMQPNMPIVQAAALRLVRTLRPKDVARVVQFNHRHTVVQDFTPDHALLEAAVRSIHPEGATGLYNAVYLSLKELARQAGDGEIRKRAMVILSDGADTTSLLSDDQVLEAARRAEVNIYAVGLGITGAKDATAAPEIGRARYFLTALAEETGGQPFFPRGLAELDGVYDRIAQELSTQYAIGYVSSNARLDGKWRRVVVQSRTGLMLRHRAGYYAGVPVRIRAGVPPASGPTRTLVAATPK